MAALLSAALGACAAPPGQAGFGAPPSISSAPAAPGPAGRPAGRVALLLPLTGANAELGQAMLRAAQLSYAQPGAPPGAQAGGQADAAALDPRDTGSTPEGAAAAASAALEAGAGIILGPLTAPETAAVAPIARAAGVPVLAFTSDAAQAQSGVWTLGVTPAQQVRRLVLAVQAEGRSRVAAVVPENSFGNALVEGLSATSAAAGLPPPRVHRYAGGFPNLSAALKEAADYPSRRGEIEVQQRAARARNDEEGRREADELGRQTPPPPAFDALLLGAAGDQLAQAVPLLTAYDIGPGQVRVLGPALWARQAASLGALSGAWYAATDPAARAGFEQQYAAAHGGARPRELASLAYDAAGIARAVSTGSGFPIASLERPEGFLGADGLLALRPNGQVRRGLAIFEIDRGGAHIVQPAPQSLGAPGV